MLGLDKHGLYLQVFPKTWEVFATWENSVPSVQTSVMAPQRV